MEAQFFQVIVHPPPVERCVTLFPIHSAFPTVWSSRSLLFSPSHQTRARTAHQRNKSFFYVRAVVDGVMATNFFSYQPLPSGTAPGIVTSLKRAMAHADVDLDVWIRKLFFYCGEHDNSAVREREGSEWPPDY